MSPSMPARADTSGVNFMRKAVTSVVAVLMVLFVFAGCGPKTIEQAFSDSDLQKMCDEIKSNSLFSTYYNDVKVEVKENDITYEYWYNMTMDEDQIAAVKASLEDGELEGQIEELKDSFEKQSRLRPNKITYIYYTADDQLIAKIEG